MNQNYKIFNDSLHNLTSNAEIHTVKSEYKDASDSLKKDSLDILNDSFEK
jgi:hypothetical protein